MELPIVRTVETDTKKLLRISTTGAAGESAGSAEKKRTRGGKMPATSGKQYRFMQAAAHGGLKGPQQIDSAVAKEFVRKTPPAKRKMWSKQPDNKLY